MTHRDQEIALLRQQLELLIGERQALLHVVGASAALIASLDSGQLPVRAIEAADQLATSINRLPEESLRDALSSISAEIEEEDSVPGEREGQSGDDA
jgi:hypothetical protein